ncbi:MAG: redox-sensitive transcriptional activator SoxR [Planctomycetota bacterium]
MDSTSSHITIGELAERTGLATSALRFYESKGLLTATRTTGGQRRYARADIRRVSFILITQTLGYSLAQIADQLAQLPESQPPTKRDWERLAHGFRRDIDERIRGLQRLRDKLSSCIGCGCLSLQSCRIYNKADAAADHGPGPRYLMGDSPQG